MTLFTSHLVTHGTPHHKSRTGLTSVLYKQIFLCFVSFRVEAVDVGLPDIMEYCMSIAGFPESDQTSQIHIVTYLGFMYSHILILIQLGSYYKYDIANMLTQVYPHLNHSKFKLGIMEKNGVDNADFTWTFKICKHLNIATGVFAALLALAGVLRHSPRFTAVVPARLASLYLPLPHVPVLYCCACEGDQVLPSKFRSSRVKKSNNTRQRESERKGFFLFSQMGRGLPKKKKNMSGHLL